MNQLTLFAMTKKGHAVLEALLDFDPRVVAAVVSSRDRSVAIDYFDALRHLCEQRQIPFFDRTSQSVLPSTEFAMCVSWRWMLPVGGVETIVLHDSILPRYRGFNPLVTALVNGDTEIGVTALFAGPDYDRGAIIAQSATSIEYPLRIQDAIEAIIPGYRRLATEIARSIVTHSEIVGTAQDESLATYSLWRDDDDYFLDWSRSAAFLRRFIDAVGPPYKGAATILNDRVVRILQAEECGDVQIENRVPGKTIFIREARPVVVCGKGLLRLDVVLDNHSGETVLPLSRFRVRFGHP